MSCQASVFAAWLTSFVARGSNAVEGSNSFVLAELERPRVEIADMRRDFEGKNVRL
jgi:hypothetical protein